MSDPVAPLRLNVDGVHYPLDVAAVSAADEVMMAAELAIPSRIALFALVDAGTAERRHVVALMAVSLRQRGLPVDLPALLEAVTLSSVVQMAVDTPDPDEVDEALAALAAAYMAGVLDDDEFEAKRAQLTGV